MAGENFENNGINREDAYSDFDSLTEVGEFNPELAREAREAAMSARVPDQKRFDRAQRVISKKEAEIADIDAQIATIDEKIDTEYKRPSAIFHANKEKGILEEKKANAEAFIERAEGYAEKWTPISEDKVDAEPATYMKDDNEPIMQDDLNGLVEEPEEPEESEKSEEPEESEKPEKSFSRSDRPFVLDDPVREDESTPQNDELEPQKPAKTVETYSKEFESLPDEELAREYIMCLDEISENFTSHTTTQGVPRGWSQPNHYDTDAWLLDSLVSTATNQSASEIRDNFSNYLTHSRYRKAGTADRLIEKESEWLDAGARCEEIAKKYGAESIGALEGKYEVGSLRELREKLNSIGMDILAQISEDDSSKERFGLFHKKESESNPKVEQLRAQANWYLSLAKELTDAGAYGLRSRERELAFDEAYGGGGHSSDTISDDQMNGYMEEFYSGERVDLINKAVALRRILNKKGLINQSSQSYFEKMGKKAY